MIPFVVQVDKVLLIRIIGEIFAKTHNKRVANSNDLCRKKKKNHEMWVPALQCLMKKNVWEKRIENTFGNGNI